MPEPNQIQTPQTQSQKELKLAIISYVRRMIYDLAYMLNTMGFEENVVKELMDVADRVYLKVLAVRNDGCEAKPSNPKSDSF